MMLDRMKDFHKLYRMIQSLKQEDRSKEVESLVRDIVIRSAEKAPLDGLIRMAENVLALGMEVELEQSFQAEQN